MAESHCRRLRHRTPDQISSYPPIFRCVWPVKLLQLIRVLSFFAAREMAHWTSPIFKYALLVVHRALEKSGIVDYAGNRAAGGHYFQFSAVGGLDAVLQADRLMIAGRQNASSLYQSQFLHQYGRRQGFHSYRSDRADLLDDYGLCHRNYFSDHRRNAVCTEVWPMWSSAARLIFLWLSRLSPDLPR